MRRIASLCTLILALFSGLLVTTGPVAAAPAQPYQVDECVESSDGFVLCTQEHGVVKVNDDGTMYVANGQRCVQYYAPTGEFLQGGCSKSHSKNILTDDGTEPQVSHAHGSSESTFDYAGITVTCTSSSNVIFANGEYRHETTSFECDPPLPS